MNSPDRLRQLMLDFFELPDNTEVASLVQAQVAGWDSFAMVHLITELQVTFGVEFDVEEIVGLNSYEAISRVLERKGVKVNSLR